MDINVESWHYKVVKKGLNNDEEMPTSLCPYVKKLLVTMFLIFAGICGAILIMCVIGFSLFHTFAAAFGFTNQALGIALPGSLVTVWFLYSILTGMIKSRKEFEAWEEEYNELLGIPPKEKKEANIFVEYVKAAHSKVCPTLEYKN